MGEVNLEKGVVLGGQLHVLIEQHLEVKKMGGLPALIQYFDQGIQPERRLRRRYGRQLWRGAITPSFTARTQSTPPAASFGSNIKTSAQSVSCSVCGPVVARALGFASNPPPNADSRLRLGFLSWSAVDSSSGSGRLSAIGSRALESETRLNSEKNASGNRIRPTGRFTVFHAEATDDPVCCSEAEIRGSGLARPHPHVHGLLAQGHESGQNAR